MTSLPGCALGLCGGDVAEGGVSHVTNYYELARASWLQSNSRAAAPFARAVQKKSWRQSASRYSGSWWPDVTCCSGKVALELRHLALHGRRPRVSRAFSPPCLPSADPRDGAADE